MEIWLFHGAQGRFASGVFTTREKAEVWIAHHKLSGVLTLYPVNQGVYDWAISNDLFEVKKSEHSDAPFIQKFTTASQEHYHYEDGLLD